MIKLTKKEKKELEKVAKKYNLIFIIAHGSYATGKERPGSDLNIAVLGNSKPSFEEFWGIHDEIKKIICGDTKYQLNLQVLHHIDPLLRYIIMRDSKFLAGNHLKYTEFYCYAFRDFDLHRKLFELQRTMMKGRIDLLDKFLPEAANI